MKPPETQRPSSTARTDIAVIALLGALFIASFVLPASPLYEIRVCMFHNATGYSCPGCGLGRSFCAVSQGELSKAFSFHWLGPLLYVGFLFILMRSIGELVLRRRLPRLIHGKAASILGMAGIGVVLIVWVIRLARELSA